MDITGEHTDDSLSLSGLVRIDQFSDRFEQAVQDAILNARVWPNVEDYLGDTPEPLRFELRKELLAVATSCRRQHAGNGHPGLTSPAKITGLQVQDSDPCRTQETLTADQPAARNAASDAPPRQIGRYRVEGLLGEGAFGKVYRCYDDVLKRSVALKVPLSQLLDSRELYLAEAQVLARLEHPAIVPVYDAGQNEDGLCYVVSKFIEGSDLRKKTQDPPLSHRESAELVATIAEALHHAHLHGVVHRDVKPANILIDAGGRPYLADFGMALKEEDFGTHGAGAGTPFYMSPEQARREGHLVDGRSDIFSLGVVFYELLTVRRPFTGSTTEEILQRIRTLEPCPPGQLDDTLPKELERICLKALSKRATERYATALDMAQDLRAFLAGQKETKRQPSAHGSGVAGATAAVAPHAATVAGSARVGADRDKPLKIVPKGLRSFDAEDADFFLELLPGARDRDGLPEGVRFWKHRVEEADPDKTFRVGLIYGPSGCGKSSLVKAGLLPRLAGHVTAVYVEATAEGSEPRLLGALRRCCPRLPDDLGLIESIAALRRGRAVPPGKKVLIVLDHFEQWLHARQSYENTELVEALRHCDGERVQCIVMVRDDFWMAMTRFLGELEIRLLEGHNSAAVDLFDLRQARKVLAAFGQAYGVLPEDLGRLTRDHNAFLEQAVDGLAREGKIVCVRLALFAQMMNGKRWAPATLKAVGGTQGVGVTFLDEAFSAATAPPEHRLHQKASRAILNALLPDSGTEIKGQMRSYAELLEVSGYASRRKDFDDLIGILDKDIRLITPTDPEGKDDVDTSTVQAGGKYFQLTHDYLVHSIREWLTRKQKETRCGRAELLLADRAAVWNSRPENRQLPSLLQWFQIKWLTRKKNWTPPQWKMMHKAGWVHGIRSGVVTAVLVVMGLTGLGIRNLVVEKQNATRAEGLVDGLVKADIAQVSSQISSLEAYRRWADPLLEGEYGQAKTGSPQKLHAALALLPIDESKSDYLRDQLLVVTPQQFPIVRDALLRHKTGLVETLWSVALDAKRETQPRFQAACALATYAAADDRWQQIGSLAAGHLVTLQASEFSAWREALHPAKVQLLKPLTAIYKDKTAREQSRAYATEALAEYAADNPQVLTDLLMVADEQQFAVLYAKLQETGERVLPLLTTEIDRTLPPDARDDAKEKLAKRQANAAAVLLRMNQPARVWPLLKHSPDPRARGYLVHRLAPLGVPAETLIRRLDSERDVSIRRALILGLGEYAEGRLSESKRNDLLPRLQAIYRNEADAGLHAAAEWLLRKWKQDAWIAKCNEDWKTNQTAEEKRRARIIAAIDPKIPSPPQWYVNSQGQTMVVLASYEPFVMGSGTAEIGRDWCETQHSVWIGRTFALSAKAVTLGQFRKYRHGYLEGAEHQFSSSEELPAVWISWFDGAEYCNWLSEKEGIAGKDWCYEVDAEKKPVKLKANYLGLSGYRLPNEAEMEYAARAGAQTGRFYGETDELLGKYAWFLKNSEDKPWPVGLLKPNDWGLFDAEGNVYTWCQERWNPRLESGNDSEAKELIIDKFSRALRGGSFSLLASHVRSAFRNTTFPDNRLPDSGFRVARTLLPSKPYPP